MPPLLEANNLGRRIGGAWIWRYLCLGIEPGASLGLVGPTGTGKSLFLRAAAGLDEVQEGSLRYRGRSLQSLSMPEYRTCVVYVQQRPALLEGSVEDNLRALFGFSIHRGKAFDRAAMLAWLETLGRPASFLQRDAASLSGGEAQMVACVRALQLEPKLLLLDEPTASLDAESRTNLERLILSWHSAAEGRAFVLTSHDRDQIDRLCGETLSLE